MGCDIHMHTEVKIGGVWHHYGAPNVGRSYALFARMADVRNDDKDVEPIAPPRGIPADASVLTKFTCAYDGEDGHSHSYLNSVEIAALGEWCGRQENFRDKYGRFGESSFWFEEQFGFLFGNTWPGFHKYRSDAPKGVEDVRFVFWFDN